MNIMIVGVDLSVRANLFDAEVEFQETFSVLHLKEYNFLKLVREAFQRSFKSSYIFNNKQYFKTIGFNFPLKAYFLISHVFFCLLFY